jgi:hypothetical protein
MIGQGDSPFVGIPLFPSRYFRHSSVYYNVESGIKKPEDFKGKKVGTPEYAMTAGVWIRGFFSDDYGVRAQDMKWFLGGQADPGRKERVKLELPPDINIQSIPDDKTLNGMLESAHFRPQSVFPRQRVGKGAAPVSQLQGSGNRILQAHENISHHAHRGDS